MKTVVLEHFPPGCSVLPSILPNHNGSVEQSAVLTYHGPCILSKAILGRLGYLSETLLRITQQHQKRHLGGEP